MNDKLLLLGLLRQQEMHGYQLYKFIERGLSACTDLKKPAAYYLLARMAADGWLSETVAHEGNRPPRKVYRLTPAGDTAFEDLLRQNLAGFQMPGLPGDVGLAFLDVLDAAESLSLLAERRLALRAALANARQVPPHRGSLALLVEHQVHYLESELGWLETVIDRLKTRLPGPALTAQID